MYRVYTQHMVSDTLPHVGRKGSSCGPTVTAVSVPTPATGGAGGCRGQDRSQVQSPELAGSLTAMVGTGYLM